MFLNNTIRILVILNVLVTIVACSEDEEKTPTFYPSKPLIAEVFSNKKSLKLYGVSPFSKGYNEIEMLIADSASGEPVKDAAITIQNNNYPSLGWSGLAENPSVTASDHGGYFGALIFPFKTGQTSFWQCLIEYKTPSGRLIQFPPIEAPVVDSDQGKSINYFFVCNLSPESVLNSPFRVTFVVLEHNGAGDYLPVIGYKPDIILFNNAGVEVFRKSKVSGIGPGNHYSALMEYSTPGSGFIRVILYNGDQTFSSGTVDFDIVYN